MTHFLNEVVYKKKSLVKFGHSEKATKIWNNLPLNFFKFCGLLRKPEHYHSSFGKTSSQLLTMHTTCMLISKIHLKKTCSMKRENNFLKLTWFYIMKTSTSPNSDVYLFWYKVFSSSSSISAVQWPTKQNCVGTGHSRLDNNKRLEENWNWKRY